MSESPGVPHASIQGVYIDRCMTIRWSLVRKEGWSLVMSCLYHKHTGAKDIWSQKAGGLFAGATRANGQEGEHC